MARRNPAQLQFDALSLEGALLPPEWLARVAALEAPAQTPADYGVPKGLQLRDEIGRYWRIAQATWTDFAAARGGADPTGAARRLARDLLTGVFGFADLVPARERTAGGRTFPLAFEALGGRVPVVVGPSTEGLDQSVPRHGDGNRRRSAWGALQEYLNAADGALWGLATNGLTLRLGRDNASMTRPAWLEADLERIFAEERFADFSVLWLLLHASRFGRVGQPGGADGAAATAPTDAPLERWREAGREEGSRARDALRLGVEEALRALGQGFVAHPANGELRAALAGGALAPADYFNELLRLVYRMIFLLTVEERGILHAPDADPGAVALYAGGYGMRRLRERALRHAAHDRHGDLWASLRPVFAALGRAEGEPALGLPGLDGLFAPDQCPHLDGAALENRALLTAVFRLAWLREGDALARVNWKDMGVEEFGSVYESLLELVPVVSDGGRRFGFAGEGESAGNARKLTGSYYTPDALVQQLLDTALEPVVVQRLAEHPDPKGGERALLSLAVVDPACGSGHFLLAAARRLAGHLARLRAGGTPGAAEYRHALRDVVTHCIHGVDRNPMALELARMALWLEAYTPDRALGFLDHHLVCGDALLGLLDLGVVKDGIPDEAFKALTGDDKDVAKVLTKLNRAGRKALDERRKRQNFGLALGTQSLGEAWAALDALSDDGLAGVEAKRAAYARLRAEAEVDPRALAADLFVGAFLMPKALADGERVLTDVAARARFPSTSALVSVLDGTMGPEHTVVQAAREACAEARVLHWPLAFPQVFARGGFDVVLGNPPWELVEVTDKDYFAHLAPEIASATSQRERLRLLDDLRVAHPSLYAGFQKAMRHAAVFRAFAQCSGRFPLSSGGRVNLYPLFTEHAMRLVGPRGRMGFVVPTAVVMDVYNAPLARELVEQRRLHSLFDFENRRPLFPAVHRSYRFALLTAGAAGEAPGMEFAWSCAVVEELRAAGRRLPMTTDDLLQFSPNNLAPPILQTREDLELARRAYARFGVLVDDRSGSNPWGASIQRMLALSDGAELFRHASDFHGVPHDPGEWAPLYAGKYIGPFNHRFATYEGDRVVNMTEAQLSSPAVEPRFERYVRADEVVRRLDGKPHDGWLLAVREIARATDERTVIAAAIPAVGCETSCRNVYLRVDDERLRLCFLANLNSLALNYFARQKVIGTHLNSATVEQLPFLRPDDYLGPAPLAPAERLLDWVSARVLALSFTSESLRPFAAAVGYRGACYPWVAAERERLMAELDACFCVLYGMSEKDVRHMLSTFPIIERKEMAQYGAFRTRDAILRLMATVRQAQSPALTLAS